MFCSKCKSRSHALHVGDLCGKCFKLKGEAGPDWIVAVPGQAKEKKSERDRKWESENIEHRRAYWREYARKRNNRKFGAYIVEHQGRYKQRRGGQWGQLDTAKIYKTRGYASLSVLKSGKGTIIEKEKTHAPQNN